ncbi:MAG: hypothetical protein A2126_00750 [Candidatus Woykebacteria bacterium GWB1_45_5]|uniref:Uncharacterized protein n=2 Tax=Candidatus Woykeibacteriota TaxID=1817899 RepID=A0A1G1W3C1_9BACT|nr:MAG: hypothetical protein A2113_03530 [Candidatus Woykebacteria bacterium GWA1_44_8]OGY24363.1 MAG: hypothetical protein A2126_00750 [Candidatus Woykebacteria bacterium GWB1_45_5]
MVYKIQQQGDSFAVLSKNGVEIVAGSLEAVAGSLKVEIYPHQLMNAGEPLERAFEQIKALAERLGIEEPVATHIGKAFAKMSLTIKVGNYTPEEILQELAGLFDSAEFAEAALQQS